MAGTSAPSRDFKGIWIPKELWLRRDMTLFEKCLVAEIDSLSTTPKGAWPSSDYLADFFDVSKGHVDNTIYWLGMDGFLNAEYEASADTANGRKRFLKRRPKRFWPAEGSRKSITVRTAQREAAKAKKVNASPKETPISCRDEAGISSGDEVPISCADEMPPAHTLVVLEQSMESKQIQHRESCPPSRKNREAPQPATAAATPFADSEPHADPSPVIAPVAIAARMQEDPNDPVLEAVLTFCDDLDAARDILRELPHLSVEFVTLWTTEGARRGAEIKNPGGWLRQRLRSGEPPRPPLTAPVVEDGYRAPNDRIDPDILAATAHRIAREEQEEAERWRRRESEMVARYGPLPNTREEFAAFHARKRQIDAAAAATTAPAAPVPTFVRETRERMGIGAEIGAMMAQLAAGQGLGDGLARSCGAP